MKIVIFTENYFSGGMDVFIATLVNNWPENDRFIIVCNHGHPGIDVMKRRIRKNVKIISHKFPTRPVLDKLFGRDVLTKTLYKIFIIYGQYLLFLLSFFFFRNLLRRLGPDSLIVCNGGYPAGDTCRATAITGLSYEKWGKPLFIYHNTPMPARILKLPFEWAIDKILEKSIACLITVSRYTQGKLVSRPVLNASRKKKVIYNGIDNIVTHNAKGIKEELGIPHEVRVILSLGTYEERKGHALLIDAFKLLKAKTPKVCLIIAGFGYPDDESRIKNLIKDNDVTRDVYLLGFRHDVVNLMKSADILVVSSVKDESFGLTMIEAMAQGVPVVATRIGGIPEVLEDGGGCLVEPDAGMLSEKMYEVLKNESLRLRLSGTGLKIYNDKFRADIMAGKYYDLIREHVLPGIKQIGYKQEMFNMFLKTGCGLRPDVFLFFINEFLYRIVHKIVPEHVFYPKVLKYRLAEIKAERFGSWALPGQDMHAKQHHLCADAITLKLAGATVHVTGKLNWFPDLSDNEDREAMHRFGWLLYGLSANPNKVREDYFEKMSPIIEDWFGSAFDKNIKVVWNSYTVSERISNLIIFCFTSDKRMPLHWQDGLKADIMYLLDHMECRGKYTNNHILNNGRALYLAGSAFGNARLKETGKEIIKKNVPELIKNGFLREGSSHYQFLAARWLREIDIFAELNCDNEFSQFLKDIYTDMANKCRFLTVYDEKRLASIPCIGDISPDFTPEWLMSLTEETGSGWRNVFLNKGVGTANDNACSSRSIFDPMRDWVRIDRGPVTLFWHIEKNGTPLFQSHGHCDTGSVVMYFNGQPVLIDTGRHSYEEGESDKFRKGCFHNGVSVDGFDPFIYEKNFNYPLSYRKADVKFNVFNDDEGVRCVFTHNGFSRLAGDNITFRRVFFLNDKNLAVNDTFSGNSTRLIQTFFHFGGSLEIEKDNDGLRIKGLKAVKKMRFSVYSEKHAETSIIKNMPSSDSYGKTGRHTFVVVRKTVKLPVSYQYRLMWEV